LIDLFFVRDSGRNGALGSMPSGEWKMERFAIRLFVVLMFLTAGIASAAPIHAAVKAGSIQKVTAILDKDPQQISAKTTKEGETPLHIAVGEENATMTKFLLARGADVNAGDIDGTRPLTVAVSNDDPEIAEMLISKGADPKARDNDGVSCLEIAAAGGDGEIVVMLLGKGADPKGKDKTGMTPLHYAAGDGEDDATDTVRLDVYKALIEKGADVMARDLDGVTPLHPAAAAGEKESVEYLLTRGANPNARDKDGKTPYDWAVEAEETETAATLKAKMKFDSLHGPKPSTSAMHR